MGVIIISVILYFPFPNNRSMADPDFHSRVVDDGHNVIFLLLCHLRGEGSFWIGDGLSSQFPFWAVSRYAGRVLPILNT